MTKIMYSRLAKRDLEEMGDYIAEEYKSPISARKTVNKMQDAIDRLAEYPHSGAPLSARYEDVGDYRYIVSGNYLAFYRIVNDIVFVDRILYSRRDYLSIIFGDRLRKE